MAFPEGSTVLCILWILKQRNIYQVNSLLEETFGTRLYSPTSTHITRTTSWILLLQNKGIAPRYHLRKQNKLKKNNGMLIFTLSAPVEIKTIIEENLQYILYLFPFQNSNEVCLKAKVIVDDFLLNKFEDETFYIFVVSTGFPCVCRYRDW